YEVPGPVPPRRR
nr:Chain C, PROTEIN (SH3 PEPTOID INHIBITOR) [unidentified]